MTIKIAISQFNSRVGDINYNSKKILEDCKRAAEQNVSVLLTPELSLTGYPLEDLITRSDFLSKSDDALADLKYEVSLISNNLALVIGHPFKEISKGTIYNCASVILGGKIIGKYKKVELPNYGVFDEKRYFQPGESPCVFSIDGYKFGISICEDVWFEKAPKMAKNLGADILLILNASPFHQKKKSQRLTVVRKFVSKNKMAAVFCNLIGGQDELVFEGDSFALNCEGKISARAKQFSEDFLVIECDENKNLLTSRIERQNCFEGEIYSALVLGLRDYFIKNNFSRAVLGLSGGIDSAVSLAIAVEAVGKENVKAIMMQTEFTSASSLADARECAMNFNIEFDEIPIQVIFDLVRDSLKSVFEGKVEEITKENLQSRIRGVLLMAISNNENRLLISTGNKSEIAVGYSTLYGDMCGSFCVLKDIFKTDVYKLARFINSKGVNKQNKALIPNNILLKSPSAELKFDQVDEDSLPPYNILDDILRRFIEENQSAEVIINSGHSGDSVGQVLQLLKNSEFKRKQASPGVKISPTGFGRDWRFPITNSFSFNRSAT